MAPTSAAGGRYLTTKASQCDANDNILTAYASNGTATTSVYDDAVQAVQAVAPKDEPTDPERKTTTTYDKVGNVVSVTEPRGNLTATAGDYTTTTKYDPIYLAIEVTNGVGQKVSSVYDNVGNLVMLVDAKKNATADTTDFTAKFEYDLAHRLEKGLPTVGRAGVVVNQDRLVAGEYGVGVYAGDGDVVDLLVPGLVADLGDLYPGSGTGLQPHAVPQILRRRPATDVRQPELVVVGGDDLPRFAAGAAVGVDRDGVKVLHPITGNQPCDRPHLLVGSLHVGGTHLVADLDVLDRFAGAVGHQHRCTGYERWTAVTWTQVPAAVGSHIPGFSFPASAQVPASGNHIRWLSVEVIFPVFDPLLPSTVSVTRFSLPSTRRTLVTGRYWLPPVSTSAASTWSSSFRSSIALLPPAASNTRVPGMKLFGCATGHAESSLALGASASGALVVSGDFGAGASSTKVAALNQQPLLVVTKVNRKGSASAKWTKSGRKTQPGMDVDHTIDLQLGGMDDVSNMALLNTSVNRSLGSQIDKQLKKLGLTPGDLVGGVRIIPGR